MSMGRPGSGVLPSPLSVAAGLPFEDDVGGLDVAVDDPHGVGIVQRVGDLGDQLGRLAGLDAVGLEVIGQG